MAFAARARTAQTLNSGIRLSGSSAGTVSRLAACRPPQWNGGKQRIGPNIWGNAHPKADASATTLDQQLLALNDSEAGREARMDLHQGLGLGVAQRLDQPRLRAAIVVFLVAPSREK